jgi:hypothetical protein
MKIAKLAIDKIMRMEICIDFHLYRPDISCGVDLLRERVEKIFFFFFLLSYFRSDYTWNASK